jgi:glycosyltransferase involved in cell wall biosynthesis
LFLRILFLLTQSLESPGGAGRHYPLACELVKQGHQVTLLALHHNWTELKEKSFIADGVVVRYVGQMHVRKVGNQKFYFPAWQLLWLVSLGAARLAWHAWRAPCDVIHVCKTQPMNGVAAWAAHRLKGTPIYLDSDDYEAVNNRFSGRWQQRIVAWFEDWLPSFAAGITVNTTFIANRFIALGYPKEKIVLVPNGAAAERFAILDEPAAAGQIEQLRERHGVVDPQKTIVYIGSLSLTSHAIDLLLEAFALVCQTTPDARLLLVGAGEAWDYLRQLSERLGVADQTCFVGRVPANDVPYYYHLGCVTVDPMRRSLPAESSLSLKLVESIAAGMGCITADIGDRKEIAGEAALVVPPDDAAALARACQQIFRDPALAARLQAAARRLRKRHWWSERAHSFAQVYHFSNST